MARIENISDQLEGYAQEAASTIKAIARQYDMTINQAAAAVQITAMAMQADALHHVDDVIREHSNQTGCINDAVNALADVVNLLPPAE